MWKCGCGGILGYRRGSGDRLLAMGRHGMPIGRPFEAMGYRRKGVECKV